MWGKKKNIPGRVKNVCKGPEVERTSTLLRNCRKTNQAAAQRMRLCGMGWRVNLRTDHVGHYRPSMNFSLYPTEAHGIKVFTKEQIMALSQITNALLILVSKENNNTSLNY